MYQIKQGDCLELMGSIPDKSIDMILADLPYGTTACPWDTIIPFEPLWENYKRIIKSNGCIALFGSEPFSSYLRLSNIKQYKYDWIWEKNRGSNFALTKYQPMKEHETISIFSTDRMKYFPIKEIRKGGGIDRVRYDIYSRTKTENYHSSLHNELKLITTHERVPSSIQKFNTEVGYHPTQKPISLLSYLIQTYTLENETVLDNTMGSGSTGVACIRTNRNFIGFEKDSNYYKIAEKRILDEIDKTALFNIEKAS